jgi:hypothetical protein
MQCKHKPPLSLIDSLRALRHWLDNNSGGGVPPRTIGEPQAGAPSAKATRTTLPWALLGMGETDLASQVDEHAFVHLFSV